MLQQPVFGQGWNLWLTTWTDPKVFIQCGTVELWEISCFTSGVCRSFRFVCLYFTTRSEVKICPHPCDMKSLLEFKSQQEFPRTSVPAFLSLFLLAQSLLSCCHLFFTLLLRSYNDTTFDGSSSCQSFSLFWCTSLIPCSSSAKQSPVVRLSSIYES